MLTLEFWRAVPEWYQFMGAAAAAVAGANADVLVIAGGTDSESLLAYIATQPLLPPGVPGHECDPLLLFLLSTVVANMWTVQQMSCHVLSPSR